MDTKIRQQALDPTQSFIVEAPAGSGKTELLVQRFLSLLSTNVRFPEEILAITFTRKAAHEMRARIISALEKALNDDVTSMQSTTVALAKKVLKRNTEEHWQLLANPNRLRIQTIDALCMSLTQQMPIISGLGAQACMANHPEDLYQRAVEKVLATLDEATSWQQDLITIFHHFDNQYSLIKTVFMDMLSRRDQWLPYVAGVEGTDKLKKHFEAHLQHIYHEARENVLNHFPTELLAELIPVAQYAGYDFSQAIHQDLCTLLLTQEGHYRKQVDKRLGFPADAKNNHKKLMQEILLTLQDNEALRIALIQFREAPPMHYAQSSWSLLKALLTVLPLMAAELWLIFQQYKQIDFIEVASRALQALGDDESPTDLALVLDYQLQHILVDEFQDTSITQYKLLEKLTYSWQVDDGHSLFLVGDPMQSIYRFRQANVGLFLKAKFKGIGSVKLTPLQLSQNFRSHPVLIDWLNHVMPHIMPQSPNISMGAIPFSPCIATKVNDDTGLLTCILAQDQQHEALSLVDKIKKVRAQHPDWTIAILVRARSHLKAILPLLKMHELPYHALEIEPLANQAIIQDLLALTFALLDMHNRLAWLALLRAPICGITLAEIEIIANVDEREIWDILQDKDVINLISTDSRARIARFIQALEPTVNARARMPLARWVESAWLATGAQFYTHHQNLKNTAAFFQLLTELESEYRVVDMQVIQEHVLKLYTDELPAVDNPIQVMTMHKAKGLEFDAVFLPGLSRRPAMNSQPLLRYIEQTLDSSTYWLLAPIHAKTAQHDPIYQYLARLEKHQDAFEIQRLLYVALTRAKYQLYLFAVVDEEHNRAASQSLFALLAPYVDGQPCNNSVEIAPHNTAVFQNHRIPLSWQLPHPWYHWLTQGQAQSITDNSVDASAFSPQTIMLKQVGVVLHRILKSIAESGVRSFNRNNAKIQLRELGVTYPYIDTALEIVSKGVENTLNDPRGQWILQEHQDAKCEYVLHTFFKNKYTRMVMDRTFIVDNQRWIIDYKTGQTTDDHSAQLKAYAHAMSQIDARIIKLALYFPLTCTWKELA